MNEEALKPIGRIALPGGTGVPDFWEYYSVQDSLTQRYIGIETTLELKPLTSLEGLIIFGQEPIKSIYSLKTYNQFAKDPNTIRGLDKKSRLLWDANIWDRGRIGIPSTPYPDFIYYKDDFQILMKFFIIERGVNLGWPAGHKLIDISNFPPLIWVATHKNDNKTLLKDYSIVPQTEDEKETINKLNKEHSDDLSKRKTREQGETIKQQDETIKQLKWENKNKDVRIKLLEKESDNTAELASETKKDLGNVKRSITRKTQEDKKRRNKPKSHSLNPDEHKPETRLEDSANRSEQKDLYRKLKFQINENYELKQKTKKFLLEYFLLRLEKNDISGKLTERLGKTYGLGRASTYGHLKKFKDSNPEFSSLF